MKQKKIWGICMAIFLCILLLPVLSVKAAENTYYVSNESGNDNNSGSKTAPLATVNRAVELAASGDTIYILDDVMINDTNSDDAPFVITKALTFEGNADNLSSITLRAGGIILGADVTFENLQLGVASFLRPGIAANGHTLTLNNVHQDTTLRPLQVYGGTFLIIQA